LQRAHAKSHLKQQRQKKWRCVKTHSANATGDGANPERADAQQPKIEDRIVAPSRMPAIEREDRGRDDKGNEPERARDQRPPNILDCELEQREAASSDEETA